MTPKEQEVFEKALKTIKAQQGQLEALTAPVYTVGTVLAVFDKSVVVDNGGQRFECERPNGVNRDWIGTTVQTHPKTGQIVKLSSFMSYGQTAVVTQIDDPLITLSASQGVITTEYSKIPVALLSVGDHVILNPSNTVILTKVEIKSKYAFTTQSPLDWSDIGGCTEAKAELRKALELPYTNAEIFRFFNKKRVKGGILWGRPGNGKTLIGRACAGAIARVHSKESVSTGFIYVKGPEILSKWVGDAEEAIRTLFDHARAHNKQHGYPAVIFIDESDALLTRRGTRTAAGMEQTIVPQFCAEMDGMEDSGAFVLLATNRVDILDPAITRPGRIDRKFYIGPPTRDTAPEVFNIHMRGIPVTKECSTEYLIDFAVNELFGDKYPLYKLETDKGDRIFTLAHITSGAMIAGLVERAASFAIDRNIEAGGTPDGVNSADFSVALDAIHREQFGLNHFDELKEFVETEKIEVTGFTPCRNMTDAGNPIPKRESPKIFAIAMPSNNSVLDSGKKKGYDA